MRVFAEGRITIPLPRDGACPVCGDLHDPGEPHQTNSLLYQHLFRRKYGRYPGWADAMARCAIKVQERWLKKLLRHGIECAIPEGVNVIRRIGKEKEEPMKDGG